MKYSLIVPAEINRLCLADRLLFWRAVTERIDYLLMCDLGFAPNDPAAQADTSLKDFIEIYSGYLLAFFYVCNSSFSLLLTHTNRFKNPRELFSIILKELTSVATASENKNLWGEFVVATMSAATDSQIKSQDHFLSPFFRWTEFKRQHKQLKVYLKTDLLKLAIEKLIVDSTSALRIR